VKKIISEINLSIV